MSHNEGVDTTPPSRRSVVKGAAWAVPAVVVAAAAPTVAASPGPLTFTGGACKLPGNANDIFKGYLFELQAVNAVGPPGDSLTVISNVRLNGTLVTGFQVVIKSATPNTTCSCGGCSPVGSNSCNTFCTPEGVTQRIFIFTNSQVNSQNTEMTLNYTVYDCSTCTVAQATMPLSSGVLSTPPATSGGGSCNISGAVPPPPGINVNCAGNV
jgi:hypothetical protein